MGAFDRAWVLLKRQTTLGEHKGFEDAAFSPYGEITSFHGTTADRREGINREGLTAQAPFGGTYKNKPIGVYASNSRPFAERHAGYMSQRRGEEPALYGIRGMGTTQSVDLENMRPLREGESFNDYPIFFPEDVPRERLIEMEVESQ